MQTKTIPAKELKNVVWDAPTLVSEKELKNVVWDTDKPKKEGIIGAANRAFREQAGTLSAADEAAVYAVKKNAASRKALLEAAKSDKPEGKQGIGAYVGELLGGSAGFMAAPLAAATGTAMTGVGAPAAPFVGAGVGVAQYSVQNMVRQAEEEERAAAEGRATQGPSGLRAVAAAVPQAALDVVGGRVFRPLMEAFPFAKNLVMGGPAVKKTEQQISHLRGGDMWTTEEDALILDGVARFGQRWRTIVELLPGRTVNAVRNRYLRCESQAQARTEFSGGGRVPQG